MMIVSLCIVVERSSSPVPLFHERVVFRLYGSTSWPIVCRAAAVRVDIVGQCV
jgi:hypothetical protein